MGQKQRIVIVDSGIDMANTDFNIRSGINFSSRGGLNEIQDSSGHGTYCAAIINNVYPGAELDIVKILDHNAETSSSRLIEALEYICDLDARIVNLSLATRNSMYAEPLTAICNKLSHEGKFIVSSLANGHSYSMPAAIPSVIGVDSIRFNDANSFWYNRHERIQCVADITPVMVPTLKGSFRMFGGNSKATAYFSGYIANLLSREQDIRSFNQLNTALEATACLNHWNAEDIENGKRPDFKLGKQGIVTTNEEVHQQIIHIIRQTFSILDHQTDKLTHQTLFEWLKQDDYYPLMEEITRHFSITVNYNLLSLNVFQSSMSLSEFVESRLEANES